MSPYLPINGQSAQENWITAWQVEERWEKKVNAVNDSGLKLSCS